jgi:superfamily I DNA and RNA helicase
MEPAALQTFSGHMLGADWIVRTEGTHPKRLRKMILDVARLLDKATEGGKNLLEQTEIVPIFDYIFIDEGQDFPVSFVRLCHSLARDGKFTLAYDDLQTIFQASTPSAAEIFGVDEDGSPKASFEEDALLHKCCRNPRELLIVAHALGFGLYGSKIVQMLESPEHWEDIGYEVVEGEFEAGHLIKVERPKENSLRIISDISGFDEIVQVRRFESLDTEVSNVVSDVVNGLRDGLKPEDILVVSVDDRHAKEYLTKIERSLAANKIHSNNLHADSFGIRDFAVDGRVTLSTVHKA